MQITNPRHFDTSNVFLRHFLFQPGNIMGHKISIIPILLILFLLSGAFGCDRGVTPVSNSSHNHRQMGTAKTEPPGKKSMGMGKIKRDVVEPENVKGKWKGVVLELTDKKSGISKEIIVPLKKEIILEGTNLVVLVEYFFPNFTMDQSSISSASNSSINPAARLKIKEGESTIMDHWIFSKMPQVHSFKHEKWNLKLLKGIPAL